MATVQINFKSEYRQLLGEGLLELKLLGQKVFDSTTLEYYASSLENSLLTIKRKNLLTEEEIVIMREIEGKNREITAIPPDNYELIDTFIDKYCEIGVPYQYAFSLTGDNGTDAGQELNHSGNHTILIDQGGFISDSDVQLKVLYDLDVNSYKYNIQDIVTPTLGSPYPFIRRNGHQKYRSFNISGLISYRQEEEDISIDKNFPDSTASGYYTSSLEDSSLINGSNLYTQINNEFNNKYSDVIKSLSESDKDRIKERLYREKVISFLQDGTVKLFRTQEEGNVFVRLTNLNLTPKKELGRMLYSFSCTAIECLEPFKDNYEYYLYKTS